MIVRPRPNWWRMLLVWRGSILKRIAPQLCFVAGLSVLVVAFHGELLDWKVTLTAVPFSLVGVALAIFLGFRNSASYDRYWEARKLWGRFLIDGRTLTRQALTFIDGAQAQPSTVRPFVHGLAAFVQAARHRLRSTDASADLQRLLPQEAWSALRGASPNLVPSRVLLWLAGWLQAQREAGRIDPLLAVEMDRGLVELDAAFGGCERIAVTPLPFTYSVILHRTVYLYCLMLPFGLLDSIGVMTPLMVTFVAYTFFSVEALGDEIEEPFGTEPNDLPLEALATGIEIAMRDLIGDRDLPAMPQPKDFILS